MYYKMVTYKNEKQKVEPVREGQIIKKIQNKVKIKQIFTSIFLVYTFFIF